MDLSPVDTGPERFPDGSTCACPKCKYRLQGLPLNGTCPECGEVYTQQETVVYQKSRTIILSLLGMVVFGLPIVWGIGHGVVTTWLVTPAMALFILCAFRTIRWFVDDRRPTSEQPTTTRRTVLVLRILEIVAGFLAVVATLLVLFALALFLSLLKAMGGMGR